MTPAPTRTRPWPTDGWRLRGGVPLHASKFDLRTGQVDAPPAKLPVRTHRVVVEDGTIFVIPSEAPANLPPGVGVRPQGAA